MGDKIRLETGDHQNGPVRLQGVDFVEPELDKDWGEQPVLFKCTEDASGNVHVVTYGGSVKIIDCQELHGLHMLIREIKTSGTTVNVNDLLLIR